MGRNKGICTLCGKGGKLSFEHVPPQSAFNERGVTAHSLEDWLQRDGLDGPMPNGTPMPTGTGELALCEKCNRFLGAEYVPAFRLLVQVGGQILDSIENIDAYDARERTTILSLRLCQIGRLACAKQIISMLLVTSGRETAVAHPDLLEFVLNPNGASLPERYRLFLAVLPGPAARFTGFFTHATLRGTSPPLVGVEVAYPPYSYLLSVNGVEARPRGEITSWLEAPFGEALDVEIDLPLGFVHTAIPADLRTTAQLRAAYGD
jgi:hypothetical protein